MYIPIIISIPATIFTNIYIDILKMPASNDIKYLVLARDNLSQFVEGRASCFITAKATAKFFLEDLYCCYGAIDKL